MPVPRECDEDPGHFGAGLAKGGSQISATCSRTSEAHWPALAALGLSEEERHQRRTGIGGSDANTILSGDRERLISLWEEKGACGSPPTYPAAYRVALGCWTEPFNRQWYETLTGQVIDGIGISITCPTYAWRRSTLDGFVAETGAIWEAKHTSAFAKPDEILERYMPQLQHNMAVANADRAILSVIFGNHKFEIFEVAADWLYQLDLLQAEEDFWECVLTGTEPVPAPAPVPPRPIGVREVCLDGQQSLGFRRGGLDRKPRGGETSFGRLRDHQGTGRGRCRSSVWPRH